jgi:hypothetical protein
MSRQFKDLVISLIRPPLIVVGFIAKTIYALFFGRADKRLAQKQQDELANEIQQHLGFLFQEYGGRIIPNTGIKFPPGFDYAIVTVEAGELLFRFVRGRGDLDVQIATKANTNDWHDVSLVIGAIERPEEMQRKSFLSFADVASVLEPNMPQIKEAFSTARYADTQQNLANFKKYERVVTKQLQTEINRRLYS